jgi:hypothetical protein
MKPYIKRFRQPLLLFITKLFYLNSYLFNILLCPLAVGSLNKSHSVPFFQGFRSRQLTISPANTGVG